MITPARAWPGQHSGAGDAGGSTLLTPCPPAPELGPRPVQWVVVDLLRLCNPSPPDAAPGARKAACAGLDLLARSCWQLPRLVGGSDAPAQPSGTGRACLRRQAAPGSTQTWPACFLAGCRGPAQAVPRDAWTWCRVDLLVEAGRAWEGFDLAQLLTSLQQELLAAIRLSCRARLPAICGILAQASLASLAGLLQELLLAARLCCCMRLRHLQHPGPGKPCCRCPASAHAAVLLQHAQHTMAQAGARPFASG